jgi:hypothetical protein
MRISRFHGSVANSGIVKATGSSRSSSPSASATTAKTPQKLSLPL